MTNRIEELRRLRPILTDIVGFQELMDEQDTNATSVIRRMHEAVDLLEHLVRNDVPAITRIVSHTEPVRPPA